VDDTTRDQIIKYAGKEILAPPSQKTKQMIHLPGIKDANLPMRGEDDGCYDQRRGSTGPVYGFSAPTSVAATWRKTWLTQAAT
jgi:hypothetical protein